MFVISENCIECGSCTPFCAKEAIDWVEHKYVILTERCDQCGTCREYCPIDGVICECALDGVDGDRI